MSGRFALVIGNKEYEDPILRGLRAPEHDVNDLAAILENPEIGGFEVRRFVDRPCAEVRLAISKFLAERVLDDTTLIYFSGHGIKSRSGMVYLAVRDTLHKLPAALGIDAHFLRAEMQQCLSQRQVLILDCCYSGAFAKIGSKGANETVDTKSEFVGSGYGVVVLAATSAVQIGFEADRVIGDSKYSLFTHYLIEGLESGQADGAGGGIPDGIITERELYDYVFQRVDRTKEQAPERLSQSQGPAIQIAKNRFFKRPPWPEVLRHGLLDLVIGQNEAIDAIVGLYAGYLTGMREPGWTPGNCLFMGPTGSGKTHAVEATATVLFETSRAVLRIDCGEFQHEHEIAKLLGSPPGYLGHPDSHAVLSQQALNQYHSDALKLTILLFDEIEKASDAMWRLLLQVMDRATLTLADNRPVDLSQTMIFLTSNLGSREMSELIADIGLAGTRDVSGLNLHQKIERTAIEAAHRTFSQDFLSRLDKTVVFRPLDKQALKKILEVELAVVQERILRNKLGFDHIFVFTTSHSAKNYLLQEGTNAVYGARHLKRAIQRLVVQPMANEMTLDRLHFGDHLHIDFDPGACQLTFRKEAENLSASQILRLASLPKRSGL